MNSAASTSPAYEPGTRIGGYVIDRVIPVEAMDITMVELSHKRTGARHIHLDAKDRENTFSVVLKTVPKDSTGVAHILEHTALCGSAKFPVRDPFFSMLKRSLSTFMNAFTASDWTMYPFSTQNAKDFYNLMDVYLDAVFFPNLAALSFQQEGIRLEAADSGDGLEYKGVVYNEMKGAMSSPDQVLGQALHSALYPDTTYRFNSGGDPAAIPELTHKDLVAFHQTHYHPSNAFFYTYGNLPLSDHLALIESKVLSKFERIDPRTDVPSQPRWSAERTAEDRYAIGRDEPLDRKHQVCMAWLCSDIRETYDVLGLVLLEQILVGNTAAPLRKALMDTGLGSALSDGSGFDADKRDTMFTVGLKDVSAEDAPAIQTVILDTLRGLSKNGIDSELIDAALHQLEFHRKEVRNTPYPHGIRLLLGISSTWIHHGDPARILQLDPDLERIREAVEAGGFFEGLINEALLDNPHRVLMTLSPDPEREAHQQEAEALALKRVREELTAGDLDKIHRAAEKLRRLQEHEEDLSVLPTLTREDIPTMVTTVAPSSREGDNDLVVYDQPTAGIVYSAWALGVSSIPESALPLVPFFCYALPKSGTHRRDFVELARWIDRTTGGLGLAASARTGFHKNGDCLPFVSVTAKSLDRNAGRMMDILEELFSEYAFTDNDQLKRLFLEYRAGLEASIVHNGHRLALSAASRHFNPAAAMNETWAGLHQLLAIKSMADELNNGGIERLAETLNVIGTSLFSNNVAKVALIGGGKALQDAVSRAASVRSRMASKDAGSLSFAPDNRPPETVSEGWYTSTAVSFVGSVFPTARLSDSHAPVLAVIAKILRSKYLHREIREKGGAYGGFALYNTEDGLFGFGSYRDPHIRQTLRAFEGACDYIRSGTYNEEDITEAVLQVCSDIDKPMPPGMEARKAFYRDLIGLTDDARQEYKERLLNLRRANVLATAERFFGVSATSRSVAVISSEEKLNAANADGNDRPFVLKKI